MKDFDKNFEKSLENNLSCKMSELSGNVNCFDKISEKAFPKKNNCMTEDGYYSESGLENVTGKRHFSFAPVFTVAFVIFLGSLLVFQTNIKEFFYHMKPDKDEYYNSFTDIKSELDYETENFNYSYYDLSFDEYQMNIGCINPFAEYPLIRENENTRVRVYTKTFNVHGQTAETNQIYLVHYVGEYCDENIISITDSTAKFSKEDIENSTFAPQHNITWQNIVNPSAFSDYLYKTEDMLNMFEINYHFLYKEQESGKVFDMLTTGLFWFDASDKNADIKHYDLLSVYNPNTTKSASEIHDGQYDTVDNSLLTVYSNPTQDLWNETIYQYDEHAGFDDEPEQNLFVKENIADDIISEQGISIFTDKFLDVNSPTSDGDTSIPVYSCQNLEQKRTIEVKIPVTDYPQNITKIAEYTNDLVLSNNTNKELKDYNNTIKMFDQYTIQNLHRQTIDSFINYYNTESSTEADIFIQKQIAKSDEIAEVQAKLAAVDARLQELQNQSSLSNEQQEEFESLSKQSESLNAQLLDFEITDSQIVRELANDYVKNNFILREIKNVYSNQTDENNYTAIVYFDLSKDSENIYDKAEIYLNIIKRNYEYSVQDVELKIYYPQNIYYF